MNDRSDHEQAESIFHQLVELASNDRVTWLDAHCPDADLRREVEELLAHADASAQTGYESVFSVLAAKPGRSFSQISLLNIFDDDESPILKPLAASGKPELPERIGRYQVAGEIARGGVGSVWRARDVELGREIALKVLLDSHDGNEDATRRFVEEAQIGAKTCSVCSAPPGITNLTFPA